MTKPSFRSKFEEAVYTKAIENGGKLAFEPKFFDYVLNLRYLVDFELANGVYIETKGRLTAVDRRKMLAVKYANPDIDIRFIFQRSKNTLTKRSKTTYAQWAEKNGFKWAEGAIPVSWLKEKKKHV